MRLYREGAPEARAGGEGAQEVCSPRGLLSWFHGHRSCFWAPSLVSPLTWPIVGLDSSVKDSGRWAGHMRAGVSSPLGLSPVLPVSLWWQHCVPYLDLLSCGSLAVITGAWPGQVVSVNGSLTESGRIPVITAVLQPLFIFTSSHENSNKNKTVLLLLRFFFNIFF